MSRRLPASTATAVGVRAACSSTRRCSSGEPSGTARALAPGGELARLLLLADQGEGPDVPRRDRPRRLPAAARSWPAKRTIVGSSKRSVLYSSVPPMPFRPLAEPERQVVVGLLRRHGQRLEAHARAQVGLGGREVVQHQEGLEERRARRIARQLQGLQRASRTARRGARRRRASSRAPGRAARRTTDRPTGRCAARGC